MGKIRILSPEVVSKIAAGEVVERPSSVVKELVENALDAGCREVKVEVEAGGRKRVRVTDDGEGMSAEDALLALQRHSTSKIENERDLFAIRTFGFRGEALSAIAAVSKMKVVTRRDGELAGVELNFEGGVLKGTEAVGCPLGTSVEVRDLFFNIPARLKFMKTQGTELGHIGDLMVRAALANDHIHFQLLHEGHLLANYPVREDPSSRLAEALGKEASEKLHSFRIREGEVEAWGYAGDPGFNRANARGIYLFVNRRPVRDRLLTHAVLEAYRNLIPQGRYPVTILFVELPPYAVDVNVHPSKWEIKFSDSEAVHRSVIRGIRGMLDRAPWLAESGRSIQEDESRETRGFYGESKATPSFSLPGEEIFDWDRRSGSREIPARSNFLGQVAKTYLLFEGPDGLNLIDQHAAHERILFEKLGEEFSRGSISRQPLLLPESIELPVDDAQATEEHLPELERLGFAVEPSGGRTFWVKSVPEILAVRGPIEALREIIGGIVSWGKHAGLPRPFDPLLQMMACRGAVQADQALGQEEATALMADLQGCQSPSHCPHGRPTSLKITISDLEKMFGRK
jgi:DNA mismatch repair protein MutL